MRRRTRTRSPLQTLAELGLVGLALLVVFLGGVALAARARHTRVPPRSPAGPIAGFVAMVAHAPLDWDWQMPAVTLVALVLAAGLLALAEDARRRSSSWRRLRAPRRSAAPRG